MMSRRPPPRISIVMPVFNAEETVKEALDSMLHQSYEDWELIAVDDGSTDDSLAVLQEYGAGAPKIRVFTGEHKGIVPALRRGCAEARGVLLGRMDADDIATPHRLEAQARLLGGSAAIDFCGGRISTVGASPGSGRRRYESWINGLVDHDAITRDMFVECPLPHPTFMLRRDLYEALAGYRETDWPEDYDLVMRAWMAGARFGKPDEVILYWRDHPSRLSMTDARYSPEAFRSLKRHFLFETFLKEATAGFIQWGAGEVGKKWLREWPQPPRAVVDINPRKIGRHIHKVPVIAPQDLPPPGDCPIVVAVGAPGARDEIRDWLEPREYRETVHYRFLA